MSTLTMNARIKQIIGLSIIGAAAGVVYAILFIAVRHLWPSLVHLPVIICLVIVIISFIPLKKKVTKFLDQHFPESKIDYRRFLKHFSIALMTIVDLQKLIKVIVNTLYDFYELKGASLMLLEEEHKMYTVWHAVGDGVAQGLLPISSPLITYLNEQSQIILTSRLKQEQAHTALTQILDTFNTEMCIPLIFKEKLIGVLHLGSKRSGQPFSEDDEDAFFTLESQISVAISNALLFRQQKEAQVLLAQKNKMDAIISLSSGVNHEINNPLSIISMRCQNFLSKFSRGQFSNSDDMIHNAQEVIESSLRNANRAHLITRRLANFARPSTEEMNFQPVSIRECIEECIELIGHRQFAGDNITVTIDIPDTISKVWADKVYFQQVLYNMIMNAYHAVDHDGTITFKAYERGRKYVILEIRDTGSGIPVEHIEHIWEPFYTTKPTNPLPGKKATGSGLGLALVKRYIETAGGRISVSSTVGQGTTFYFTLSRVTEEQQNK